MDQPPEILFELVERCHLPFYNPALINLRVNLLWKNNQIVGTISNPNPTTTANTIPTRVYPAPN